METSIHRRRRILLHFSLGIGLPSLLLGYLAFRGIQNDMALLEKDRLNEHTAIARQITDSVNEEISSVEQALLDWVENRPVDPDGLRTLEPLKEQQPLIEEVFLFGTTEPLRFPLAKLLFLPTGSAKPLPPPAHPSALLSGQQYEFQETRYQEALASYEQAFAQASSQVIKAIAINAIARVQTKLHRLPDAIASYRTMAQDYRDVRAAGGMPAGVVAGLELGALFSEIDDVNSAVQTFVGLYRDLVHGQWSLEQFQYEFIAQQIDESIEQISSRAVPPKPYPSSLRTLKNEEIERRTSTERLLAFQQTAVPQLRTNLSRERKGTQNEVRRFALDIGEHSYLVSIPGAHPGNGERDNEIWGLLLDSDPLETRLLQPAIRQHILSEDIHWIIRDREGQAVLEADKPVPGPVTMRSGFSGNFPPWTLEFSQKNPRLFETLLTSRRGIYLYMFVLLAGILIFGLTLTMRIVSRELELGKMKSDFVSTVSHEFKSPLTSIRQLAEMLQAGRVPSDERRQRYYDVLLEQSERLSLLIDNILDFAKMEEGKREFEFERVDMGPLLEELVSTIQQQVRHEAFTVQAEIDAHLPAIGADRAAITQAVTNLIDNAIKYSGGANEVTVRAYTDDRHLVIAVRDFGIGIKPEEIAPVFERFYRGGDELTRTVKGSGLGLTLVEQIVEAHHGTVQVESQPGRGSTFSIRLPLTLTEDK